MKFHMIRHATVLLTYAGKKILVDPMFSEKSSKPPVDHSANTIKNPMVELPVTIESMLDIDAIIVTHLHPDHFDDTAIESLPKNLPLFCQPNDSEIISNWGFKNVVPIQEFIEWNDICLIRTGGKHGKGELAVNLGPVSGFILQHVHEPSLYIVGDSIWCEDVSQALKKYHPKYAVINSGEARFLEGGPITMGIYDLEQMLAFSPLLNIIAIHFETWNHCLLTRAEMRKYLSETKDKDRVWIPENGEILGFA
ncbi:L-ascorbate metabolism protein UlaG, beta-lactamase superfamily [Seinonella peptonophila]|uniref:L-ascorbate metabolism protein UlaG, beta-lactamase superfamily n=1 Tax=Seinonella peptonophila TaxID=112248 RepID=A0A1M4U288_9BACL|nr:MBL fold metallo-hydrolase [Seinonella peptonophila]SHE50803.1 L-ascorbate metabolism protein UlaG, beta-lactamase superfamily [Seinonella peptonophila]